MLRFNLWYDQPRWFGVVVSRWALIRSPCSFISREGNVEIIVVSLVTGT
jgi:hypothetical protein